VSILEPAINFIQDINGAINGIDYAPHLREYPSIVDTQHCCIALTGIVASSEFSTDCCDPVIIPLETQVLYKPINQGDWPDNTGEVICIADEFIQAYRDDTSYQVLGGKILRADPLIEILADNFTIPTIGLIERPLQSGRFYFGFAFRVNMYMAMDC